MCGRYSLTTDLDELDERFAFQRSEPILEPRFNIAPSQKVLTVVNNGLNNESRFMNWGLIPFWTKDSFAGLRTINARAETISWKPSFREAFKKRRCLVIADGFYEWKRKGDTKIPMRIVLKTGEPFGFAGVWETWKSRMGTMVQSCAIITTVANALMEPIHNRMPVILSREAESTWLDSCRSDTGELRELLLPYAACDMEAYEVSTLVNSYKNDTPVVIARVSSNR